MLKRIGAAIALAAAALFVSVKGKLNTELSAAKPALKDAVDKGIHDAVGEVLQVTAEGGVLTNERVRQCIGEQVEKVTSNQSILGIVSVALQFVDISPYAHKGSVEVIKGLTRVGDQVKARIDGARF